MKNNWFFIWNFKPNLLPLHHTNKQTEIMTTVIKDFDRSAFKGLRFEFVCDGKYLTIQETPEMAIEWFKSFTGQEPLEVKQVSRYPARRAY